MIHLTDRIIAPRGVGPQVTRFFDSLAHDARVIWVTYNFSPDQSLLADLRARLDSGALAELTVLCAHPKPGAFEVTLTPASFKKWNDAMGKPIKEGRARLVTLEAQGEEEHLTGTLHAKAIVARSGQTHSAAIGSFNLSGSPDGQGSGALHGNIEVFYELGEEDAAIAFEDVEQLLQWERPVTLEMCEASVCDRPSEASVVTQPDVLPIAGAPSDTQMPSIDWSPPELPPLEDRGVSSPITLIALTRALDEMLWEWEGGWQLRVFESLQPIAPSTINYLLQLPVGVGKTYIALRWLLERLAEDTLPEGASTCYLVPNAWVQHSILSACDAIVERASTGNIATEHGLTLETLTAAMREMISICRPGQITLGKNTKNIVGVVADECHNWNPHAIPKPEVIGDKRGLRYSFALGHLAGWRGEADEDGAIHWHGTESSPPVLGLSATPCRVEQGAYDVTRFVHYFATGSPLPDDSEFEHCPNMTLAQAIDRCLLARPVFTDTLSAMGSHTRAAVLAELKTDAGSLAAFGDYSQTTLGLVWDALTDTRAKRKRLIDHILTEMGAGSKVPARGRVLIFLPPVGTASDAFVEEFQQAFEDTWEAGYIHDFRSSVTQGGSGAQLVFDGFVNTRQPSEPPHVMFTIARFGEGVSVPDIDMIVMLRATLSPRVAVQALGRGLRSNEGKTDCLVLDAVFFKQMIRRWDDPQRTESASWNPLPAAVRRYSSIKSAASAIGMSEAELRKTYYDNVIAIIWDLGGNLTRASILEELKTRRQHFKKGSNPRLTRLAELEDGLGRAVFYDVVKQRWHPKRNA